MTALDDATQTLAAAGVDSPRVDAELLLAHVLGVERSALRTRSDLDHLGPETVEQFGELVERRRAREPLQYLTGTAPFRFVMLQVGPGVFIPRPETELLVDAVLAHGAAGAEPIIVDLCSGSGALAVALAHEIPSATVVAVEQAPPALQWLRRNVAGTAIKVVAGDVNDANTLADLTGRVDVVVSNPPYVPAHTPVQAEVAADPADAVFAGPDGFAVIPAVVALGGRLLRTGGLLVIEHDDTQGDSVPALLAAAGIWADITPHLDLTGRARYATAIRQ